LSASLIGVNYLTFKFKLKKTKKMSCFSRSVNFVWNYCNEVSSNAIKNNSKFISLNELQKLTAGSTKILNLNSQTIQSITEEYIKSRIFFKKNKLKWRSNKKTLGWIPFKKDSIKINGNCATYRKVKFKFYKSRKLPSDPVSGSFSQDAKGDWYINIVCKAPLKESAPNIALGVDLGLKTAATLSNGKKIENPRFLAKMEKRIALAQKAKKKKLVKNLHRKVKNQRNDFLHKETTRLAKSANLFCVGNVSAKTMQGRFGKSETDASWGLFRQYLKYKAIRHSGVVKDVSEKSTTLTCSTCLKKTGPSGLSGLVIREWMCSNCKSLHDRDVNSAINILRIGYNTPKGECLI
jgi:transposase